MTSKILKRLESDPGVTELLDLLGEGLNSSDLQSVLIEASRRRSLNKKPSGIMKEFKENRFLKPCDIPQIAFNRFDTHACKLLPDGFISIDLSPVAPFGSCSSVTGLSQNLLVSTIRHSEVIADPTNVMAIEAAHRRKALLAGDREATTPVKLCTSHRLIRTQSFQEEKFTAHFRVFSLITAGRDRGHSEFELYHMEEHIRFYLDLCRQLDILEKTQVRISDFSGRLPSSLIEEIFERLSDSYEVPEYLLDNNRTEARNYYAPLAFRIRFYDADGQGWDVVDGGFTNWTQLFLNNKKERLLISAIGTELLFRIFPQLSILLEKP